MVVSRADTHTARRVRGGLPGSGRTRQAVSPTAASALATGAGSDRPGGVTLRGEQAGDEVAEDDRLAVGDEVDLTGSAALGAQQRPWTALSMCVVDVRCRPPPIHAKRPARTISVMIGSSVRRRGPRRSAGATTVSRPF